MNSDCHGARYREEGAVGAHQGRLLRADSTPVFTVNLIVRYLPSSPHSEQLLMEVAARTAPGTSQGIHTFLALRSHLTQRI